MAPLTPPLNASSDQPQTSTQSLDQMLSQLSPTRLLITIILAVFATETLIMGVLELLFTESLPLYIHIAQTLLDASILSIVIFPVVYLLAFQPLRTSLLAYRQSQEQIRLQSTALEAAANGIVITDVSGKVVWTNPAFTQITGYGLKEIVGQSLNKLRSGMHPPAFYQQLWAKIKAGEVWKGEITNRRQSGEIYTEEQTIAPVRNQEGDITHFVAIKLDISQRKEMERALSESEMRYRLLVETSPDAIFLTDMAGNIRFCNHEATILLGVDDVENIEQQSIFNFADTSDRERLTQNLTELSQASANRNVEYQLLRLGGDRVPVEFNISVLHEEAERPSSLIAVARDISLRKQYEAQLEKQNHELRMLSQLSQAVVSSLDLDTVLTQITEQIMPLLHAECLTVMLQEGDELVCRASVGVSPESVHTKRAPLYQPTTVAAYDNRAPLDVSGQKCLLHKETCAERCVGQPSSLVLAPLQVGDRSIGVIQVAHRQEENFRREELHLLKAAANWAAIAISHARQHEQLQHQLQETAVLAAINQALNETLDMDQALQLVVDATTELIPNGEQVIVHLLSKDGTSLMPVVWGGEPELDLFTPYLPVSSSLIGQAITENRLINISDQKAITENNFIIQYNQTQSALIVPLRSIDRALGAISIFSQKVAAFGESEAAALQRLAYSATIAIETARLYQAEKDQRQLAQALLEASTAFNTSLLLDDVLQTVLQQSLQVVNCDAVSIFWIEDETAQLAATTNGTAQERPWSDLTVSWKTDDRLRWMAESGKPILNTAPTLLNPDETAVPTNHWAAEAMAPLHLGQHLIGFLVVNSNNPVFFDDKSLRRLEALAAHAALALYNAQLYQDLHKALEQEQALRSRLIQTEKLTAMGRMLASVAHELNNPLQTIRNCLFISQRRVPAENEAQSYLDMASSETERLSDLVMQLRDVYRPRTPKDFQSISLTKLLDDVYRILAPHLQRHQVKWQQPQSTTDHTVYGISSQFKQVLLNLSLNAIDAMQPNGGSLTLTFEADETEEKIGIFLRDSGPGLDKETLPHLFEPFFTTKETGTGLGLAICYDIVRSHGGQLTAENHAAGGAVFTIWLPLNPVNQQLSGEI